MGDMSVWGEVVPNWIGALGGAVGTVIAGVAFMQGRSNRAGIRAITSSTTGGATMSSSGLSHAVEPSGGSLWSLEDGGVTWELLRVDDARFELINRGDRTAHVWVFGLGTGARLKLHTAVPGDVAPGESLTFDWVKAWGEPTATSYSVQWTDDLHPGIGQWQTVPLSR